MIDKLPERLKTLRKKHRLSQREVAGILDVSPSIISAYETGERTPSVENILSLSYLYKCTTDYLLGKNDEEPPSPLYDFSSLPKPQAEALKIIINGLQKK